MKIIETRELTRGLHKLPAEIQESYERQKSLFEIDARDPRLHVKKLVDMNGVHSFRVTRAYRVLFYFSGEACIIFFMIDHRKDVYR